MRRSPRSIGVCAKGADRAPRIALGPVLAACCLFGVSSFAAELEGGAALPAPSRSAQSADSLEPLAASTVAGSRAPSGPEENIKQLSAILRGGDKDRRRAAVNKLVAMDTAEAWELVIEALDNEDAPAADEAQLDLATMDHPKVFDTLWGRAGLGSKSDIVRLRTAELIGRREAGVDAGRLAKALSERDPEVRRRLVWSIERLALAGRLLGEPVEELEKDLAKMIGRDRDGAVRGAALYAFGALMDVEAAAPHVVELAEDKDPRARSAAARNVAWLAAADWSVAEELAADPAWSVRSAAVWGLEAAARTGSRPALEVLVERVGAEANLQTQWLLVGRLQALSGMGHRVNPGAWQNWLANLPEDWTPGEAAGAGELGDDRTQAQFAGLRLLSTQLAFLIDLSGSIWNEKNGKLPKDVAGEHLNAALDRLTEDTLFNVIPYTNTPHPWEDELVRAKRKQVENAKEEFADCRERGAGNVFDAIVLALEDERTDNLVILTDGAPSGGTRWNLNLLVPELLERNRYRSVVYDTLIVGDSSLKRHWDRLAEETGGRCVRIEL